jgi:hypothetical protein
MAHGAEARARLAVFPVVALIMPWRCDSLVPPAADGGPAPSAATAKREAPAGRVSLAPPAPPPVARAVTLPDQVVVKALADHQPAFLRCWARAQRIDGIEAAKVLLHLELDPLGKVVAIQSDSPSPTLSACLAVVARQLAFPAPGQPAVVDAPLMFR